MQFASLFCVSSACGFVGTITKTECVRGEYYVVKQPKKRRLTNIMGAFALEWAYKKPSGLLQRAFDLDKLRKGKILPLKSAHAAF